MSTGFSRGPVIALALVGAVSLLVGLFLIIAGNPDDADTSAGTDTFSRSALGHMGLLELLRELGFPVHVARSPASIWDPSDSTLVFAEPDLAADPGTLRRRLAGAQTALVVLPKRIGREGLHDGWIAEQTLLGIEDVEAVLSALDLAPDIERTPEDLPTPDFSALRGRRYDIDLLGAQLIGHGVLDELVSGRDGVLLGRMPADDEHPDRTVFVLSDPDVIANHGLHRAENAAFAVALFELLGEGRESAVVFDETLHGFLRSPTLWNQLLKFPLGLVLAHGLIVVTFVLWAGMGRFGPALEATRALGAGRRTLVENTAELLVHGGHVAFLVGRYLEHTVEDVARAHHAAAGLDATQRLAFVSELAERLRTRERPPLLAAEVRALGALGRRAMRTGGARRALHVAVRIHRWKQEVLHGPDTDHRDREPAA